MRFRISSLETQASAKATDRLFLLVVCPFLLTLACVLVFATVSMNTMSAVRAYVGGEGLWSKGQKQAVYHLTRYATFGDPLDFQRYVEAIAVPLGDHKARVELEKPDPDVEVARQGFLEGRNHPDDIDGMIKLFRRFRSVGAVGAAVDIWTEADEHVLKLAELAEELQRRVTAEQLDRARIDEVLSRIDRVARILTPLEDAFSNTLGVASRQTQQQLIAALLGATLFLTALVVWIAYVVLETRERFQRALSESEERYRSFFESSIDAVLVARTDGSILAANPAACSAFGYTEEEMKSLEREAFLEDPTGLDDPIEEQRRTGGFKGALVFRRKDGSTFVGEVSSAAYHDAAGVQRASVIIRDVTERSRAEEQIRLLNASLEERVAARTAELETANRDLTASNRELEAFCYSVSHDLRLPLRAMSGFSEMLLSEYGDEIDERGHSYLRRVRDASLRMGRLIDDLLGLARFTRQPIVPTEVDLGAAARRIVEDLSREHADQHVEVRIAPNLDGKVYADPNLVRVALAHLLSNAWKFSASADKPVVEFGCVHDGDEPTWFVQDNGCGFDMAFSHKLFHVFTRLHSADEFEGTGIGLVTVHRIITRHGGRVWAEAEPGRGATFYFTLPPPAAANGHAAVAG